VIAAMALGVFLLDACAVEPPTGPNVAVMPGPNKTLPQFQEDDAVCRQFASQQTGGAAPAQAATQSAVGSAVIGTALGAAAGALLGSASGHAGGGAALGAGAGLLTGSLIGGGNAQDSARHLQRRYDLAYKQCMATRGDQVPEPTPPAVYPVYPAYPPPPSYPPPLPPSYQPPPPGY